MELLRRNLAPITVSAWQAIDDQAKRSLKQFLSARKIVDLEGPQGWSLASVPTGRMTLEKDKKENTFCFGIRESKPILEPRVSFTLKKWELDNLSRGAKDIDLSPLEDAAKKIAHFEEDVIYHGLKKAGIQGLSQTDNPPIVLPAEVSKWSEAIIGGIYNLRDNAIEGPYALVLPPDLWQTFNAVNNCGRSLKAQMAEFLEGNDCLPVILSHFAKSGLLLSLRGGDFQLTLGSDYAIGYENSTNEEVTLYLTESFTFMVFEPNAVIPITK